jgi:hypothetical protein
MDSLEFYTNEELINELLTRTTFVGIIIKPKLAIEEAKLSPLVEFDMTWSTVITDETVQKILEEAINQISEEN